MSDFKPPARIDDYVLHKEDFNTIRPSDLVSIENNAHILEIDQCLEFLGINKDALTAAELYFVEFAHKKGSARHIAEACKKLFVHMDTKIGGQSALEYLRAKQKTFKEVQVGSDTKGFSFTVVMDE